jgi:hypothetical protein
MVAKDIKPDEAIQEYDSLQKNEEINEIELEVSNDKKV